MNFERFTKRGSYYFPKSQTLGVPRQSLGLTNFWLAINTFPDGNASNKKLIKDIFQKVGTILIEEYSSKIKLVESLLTILLFALLLIMLTASLSFAFRFYGLCYAKALEKRKQTTTPPSHNQDTADLCYPVQYTSWRSTKPDRTYRWQNSILKKVTTRRKLTP